MKLPCCFLRIVHQLWLLPSFHSFMCINLEGRRNGYGVGESLRNMVEAEHLIVFIYLFIYLFICVKGACHNTHLKVRTCVSQFFPPCKSHIIKIDGKASFSAESFHFLFHSSSLNLPASLFRLHLNILRIL